MPSGGDVTADHGAAGGPCRSRPGDEVRRAPARRPRKTQPDICDAGTKNTQYLIGEGGVEEG